MCGKLARVVSGDHQAHLLYAEASARLSLECVRAADETSLAVRDAKLRGLFVRGPYCYQAQGHGKQTFKDTLRQMR